MRLRSISLAVAVSLLAAADARSQIDCNSQTCSFTLWFEDGQIDSGTVTTGSAYSGQQVTANARTLSSDGTHATAQTSLPMTCRDSDGRVRTERPVYPSVATGGPAPPDNFTVVEIRDPVAGLQYILDSVNRIAHRMSFKAGRVERWWATDSPLPRASARTNPDGSTDASELLGLKAISGAATVGYRYSHTIPGHVPGERLVTSSDETWLDPKTGILLLHKSISPNSDVTTQTTVNYSNDEPAPALFEVPPNYQIVSESAPFRMVHARTNAAGAVSSSGSPGAPSFAECSADSCTLTFDRSYFASPFGSPTAITGAPWSGRQILDMPARTLADGTQVAAWRFERVATWRDSMGRVRTEKNAVNKISDAAPPGNVVIVEIEDPVAGYQYILDTANRVAHRVPFHAVPTPFRFTPFPKPGTDASTNGVVEVQNDLDARTISGVTTVGHERTQTNPPGTFIGYDDRTFVHSTETWIDPATGVILLNKLTEDGSISIMSVPDYKTGEPDPPLFKIPSDYKIVDETSKFTFVVAVQK